MELMQKMHEQVGQQSRLLLASYQMPVPVWTFHWDTFPHSSTSNVAEGIEISELATLIQSGLSNAVDFKGNRHIFHLILNCSKLH